MMYGKKPGDNHECFRLSFILYLPFTYGTSSENRDQKDSSCGWLSLCPRQVSSGFFSKNGMVPVYPDFTIASYGTQNLHSIPTFGIWLAPEESLQFPIDCTFPVALHSFPPEHLIEQYCSCTGDIKRVHSIVHRNCRGIIAYFKHLSRNATVLVSENNTAISRKIDLVH
jgi:hypothetical protein